MGRQTTWKGPGWRRWHGPVTVAVAVAVGTLALAGTAGANETQSKRIGSGSFGSLGWTVDAIPAGGDGGYFLMLDMFEGGVRTPFSYGQVDYAVRRKRIRASELRIKERPTKNTVVLGNTGQAVKKVRVRFANGTTVTRRTVGAPSDWRTRSRYFALGRKVNKPATRSRMVKHIRGLNGQGNVIGPKVLGADLLSNDW